jgi:hypothetical protein
MVARHYLGVNRVLPGPLPERGDRNDPLPRPQLAAGEPPGPEQLAHLRRFHLPQPRQPVDGEHLGVREIVGPGLGPQRSLQGGHADLQGGHANREGGVGHRPSAPAMSYLSVLFLGVHLERALLEPTDCRLQRLELTAIPSHRPQADTSS